MEKPLASGPNATTCQSAEWLAILKAGVHAQRLVPGTVCVGETAAALYAEHRISRDTDHLLPNLKENFEAVRAILESHSEWRTARVTPPVLILGSLDGVEVGFRQPRRKSPVETQVIETQAGPLTVPTRDELLCMKAFLSYDRNATRDYLDFAALADDLAPSSVLASLLKLDERYGDLQSASVSLEVAKALSGAAPFDLDETELPRYKGVSGKWRIWESSRTICQRYGAELGEVLIKGNW